MTTIAGLVDHYGSGLLHKRQLVRHGARDHHLTAAVRRGEVRRPRRGWYTTWPPDDPRFVAVRVGGRLTGASALALLGAWAWKRRTPRITVSVPENAARLRWKRRARVVWDRPEVQGRGSAWSVDPKDALREAVVEVDFEEAVALLDWALHGGLVRVDDLAEIVSLLPSDAHDILDWVDPLCESFLESIVRTRLRMAGYVVRSQGRLPTGKRIDLVVDEVLGVETDGREFHVTTFEQDRRKDLEIVSDNRIPMRLSYSMVESEWQSVERAVALAVAMHRRGSAARSGNSGPLRRARGGDRRPWRLPRRRGRERPELPKGAGGRARPLARHRYDR